MLSMFPPIAVYFLPGKITVDNTWQFKINYFNIVAKVCMLRNKGYLLELSSLKQMQTRMYNISGQMSHAYGAIFLNMLSPSMLCWTPGHVPKGCSPWPPFTTQV
jgi:hypothetical protein